MGAGSFCYIQSWEQVLLESNTLRSALDRYAQHCALKLEAMSLDYKPVYIQFEPWLESGANDFPHNEFKANLYADGTVTWEMLRVVTLFIRRPGSEIKVSKLLSRDIKGWAQLMLELFGENGYTMSMQASIKQGQQQGAYGKEEWTLTTRGLVLMLVWATANRKHTDEKRIAIGAFLGLLRRAIPKHRVVEVVFIDEPVEALGLCDSIVNDEGVCNCAHGFCAEHAGPEGEASWSDIGHRTMSLMRAAAKCDALRYWFGCALFYLAKLLDEFAHAIDSQDDPLRSTVALRGPSGRLRRVDEDYKLAAAQAVREGRASSLPIFMRAQKDERGVSSNHWHARPVLEEMVKGQMTWRTGGVLSVACDDSRFSNPSEETTLFAVWHASSATGGWGAAQVWLLECL